MDKKYLRAINETLSIAPQFFDSKLVSAQNRKRWYWTNLCTRQVGLFGDLETYTELPKDRGILLKDVIEDEVDEKYYLSDSQVQKLLQSSDIKEILN